MIFKWLKAKCFLSIGEEGVHLEFNKLGNIVLIKGQNLDVGNQSSNGAGKSTIVECIVYGLFGKLIKGLPHKEAINKKIKKGLEIELCFELDGHSYVINRCRKPDKLTLSKDGEDITLGGMPSTQEALENLVRLNYESFVNIVCFGEHNNHAFLACDAQTKRSVVENLLGLEKYLRYCKTAKELRNSLENKIALMKREYEVLLDKKQSSLDRISQVIIKQTFWKKSKKEELENLLKLHDNKEKELTTTNDGNSVLLFEQAQERIRLNKDEVIKYETKRNEMASLVEQVQTKQNVLQDSRNELSLKVKENEHQINVKNSENKLLEEENVKLVSLKPGVKCNYCHGIVDKSNYQNYIINNSNQRSGLKDKLDNLKSSLKDNKDKLSEIDIKLTKIKDTKKQADEKLLQITTKIKQLIELIQKDSKIPTPQIGARELVIKEQIEELKRKINDKKEEIQNCDPYIDIINQTKVEIDSITIKLEETKVNIEDSELVIPYYEYWVYGFGDDGIRAYVINDILPALNARINYWLQFLIDNKIQLTFDNKFEVTIQRNPPDGDPFVYNATSGGERRRINLAISQAFAHVMMLSSGTVPSICSLDEVALNVDVPGVHGIYKMIGELARDRQVFVTTHDPNLNDLLNSCDTITVIKQDGFTTLNNIHSIDNKIVLSSAVSEA